MKTNSNFSLTAIHLLDTIQIVIFTINNNDSPAILSLEVVKMRREIEFVKCNPTQNMTLLVKSAHPREDQPRIAANLMSYDHVYAEQVGFIEASRDRDAEAYLQMAGGEFCGNACMSLAAYLASERELRLGETTEIVLETSGTDRLVACRVKRRSDGYSCAIDMPVPSKVMPKVVDYEGEPLSLVMVTYPGFYHLVMEVEQFDAEVRRKAEGLAKLLGTLSDAAVIGVMLFRPDSNEMAPLIYVPALDSLIWERGCGSGTASLGASLAWQRKCAVSVPVRQPGGTIHVSADFARDKVTSLRIEGIVGIVADGRAFIE